jgi:sugar diacid utilization regulator
VTPDDLLFARRPTERRVRLIPLADYLHAYRVGQLVLWNAVLDMVGDDAARTMALGLVTHMIHYVNVSSTHVAEVYLETERLLHASGEQVRRDLLEQLLSGRPPEPGPQLNAARTAGLDVRARCLVITARTRRAAEQARSAATAIVRATQHAVAPLAVVRQDEVVAIVPWDGDARPLIARLELAQTRLAEQGITVAIGVSTIQDGLAGISEAYREACSARERAEPGGGVVALPGMSAFEYLTAAGSPTARRLVSAAIRDFVARDVENGGALIETLGAYVAADLNATLAAERLHVHVNTARYRLAKIEEETGCHLRRMADVIDLVVAVRLCSVDPQDGPPAPAGPAFAIRPG